jgi:putative endopeptidase
MKFSLASVSASMLSKAFDQATFDFYGKTLADQPQQRAR